MRRPVDTLKQWPKRVGPGAVAAAVACLLTIGAGIFAENQNRQIAYERARGAVSEHLGLVRAKLEGNVNSNIQLVRGLIAVIEAKPDLDQAYFGQIAKSLIGNHSEIRNIAAAPDLVIRFMYPMEGNEKAIGLDYRENPQQREAALRAFRSHDLVLAGPVDLVQGGQGFIGRFPVYVDGDRYTGKFWGLVSAVMDVGELYANSDLLDPDLPIEVAIMGQDASETDRTVFFGDPQIFKKRPVLTEVSLPTGSWSMAAIPRGGWGAPAESTWLIRLLVFGGGILLMIPIVTAGRLYDQRRSYVDKLRDRQAELQRLSRRLNLALDTSRIGFWQVNIETMKIRWDGRMRELYGLSPNALAIDLDVWKAALHPEDRAKAEKELAASIAQDMPYASEFRLLLPDGEVRWIRAIGTTHREADGERHILGVNWDVTADVQLKARSPGSKADRGSQESGTGRGTRPDGVQFAP